MTDKEEAIRFLEANPDVEVLEAYVVDVNAVPRGKWIPRERALDVLTDGMAIPRSVYALDVWGRDVAAAGLAKGTGDPDGLCLPIPGTLSRVTWLQRPTAQVMLQMTDGHGGGIYSDPRNVLAAVLARSGRTPLESARSARTAQRIASTPHRMLPDCMERNRVRRGSSIGGRPV